jgi:hypothetical protein
MAIKAVAVDDQNTQHLIIGLNRDIVNSLLDGDVLKLPGGVAFSITENSDIVLLFAETNADLETLSSHDAALLTLVASPNFELRAVVDVGGLVAAGVLVPNGIRRPIWQCDRWGPGPGDVRS